jgi:dipeptidase E
MKLFLSSAGISNKTLAKAFINLVGLKKDKIKVAFIPTASNIEEGDKGWLINDYSNLKNLGLGSVDIVDISAVSEKIWKPRLEEANVLFFGGGNTFHLMHWVKKSGLEKLLPKLLKTRVYAGISAGSCIAGHTIYNSVQNLFGEKYDLKIENGLGLVDFQFIPHLNSPYFKKIRVKDLEAASKDLTEPVYALDDNSAIIVDGKKVEVISTGKWKKFN